MPVRSAAARRRGRRQLKLGVLGNRATAGFFAVVLLLGVLTGRLVQLQGLDHQNYADAAAAQRVATTTLNALRGQIVDRNGVALAYTTNAQDITADPTQVPADKRGAYADKLAPLIGVTAASIVKALGGAGKYALLARAISPLSASKVVDLDLPGIYTAATTQRLYPADTTGANVVGFVHGDGTGGAGIEYSYNSQLAGKDGSSTFTLDRNGNLNPNGPRTQTAAQNGSTVALTLDQELQYVAQQYVDSVVRDSGARNGEVAILSVKDAQVLALASSGTYDPRNLNTIDPNVPMNPPVMSVFEPGSVSKVITFAAALDKKLITPSTVINVPTTLNMGGVTIHDAWWHPALNFTATGILAESSNVGTLKIAQQIGPDAWEAYANAFGLGQATGIELPGESTGFLPKMSQWSDSSFANLPFGQGFNMTVLQLADMYQAIANDGVRIEPRIVSSVTSGNGARTTTQTPDGTRVMTSETAKTLRTMLESVTLPGATGTKAAIPGYRIAGKTGTAQQPDPAQGGKYSSTMNWDTFVGMAPADNPQFVIAIMIDNPAHGVEGGDVAAPLFQRLASYELAHAVIPPTGSLSVHVPLQVCDAATRFASPSTVC